MSERARTSTPLLERKIAVAAIDFGTTCTGYSYYLRKDTRNFLSNINIDQAWEGSAEMGLQAPTTVLIDKKGQFHSFGFQAETKYKALAETNDHKGWYYFRHFKMKLHHERELSRDMLLEDNEGKPFKALRVFTEAIRYVKSHLMKKLNNALADGVEEWQVSWVITVPAIWRDSAKQFMREAAKGAGIRNEDIMLANEPESAAISCKELAVNRSEGVDGTFLSAFNPGEKYLVADLGGGTVDTTVHEVLKDGMLKELHAATGGDWGGQVVNQAFEDLLKEIISTRVFTRFCTEKMNGWITLQKSFESRKREFTSQSENSDIEIPRGLEDIYKQVTGKELRKKRFYEGIQIVGDSTLRLSPTIMKGLFAKATDKITDHIRGLLTYKSLRNVSSILLVGGFSESQIVSKAIRDNFKKLKVIAPGSASSAILRGAVMYGIDQRIIASRISPYTYGIHTRRKYDKNRHPKSRRIQLEGREVVNNAFSKQIEKGETVYVGSDIKGSTFTLINRKYQKSFGMFISQKKSIQSFATMLAAKKIGRLSITIPEEIKDTNIKMKVHMTCQGTELEAKVSIVDFEVMVKGVFDFLDNEYQFGGDVVVDEI